MQCDSQACLGKSNEHILDRPKSKFAVAGTASQKGRDPPTASGINKSQRRSHGGIGPKPVTLHKNDFDRLKRAAQVVTEEERRAQQLKHEEAIRAMEEEAEKQKQLFKEIDDARNRGNVDQGNVFLEDKAKVLEASFLAKHEQEEEVKRVNRIMLNAKCHAIRDAQLQEKYELAKEQKKEDIRLEKIMSDRVKAALRAEDEGIQKELDKKKTYAAEIKQQLMERENQRFLESERVEEEARLRVLANEALKKDNERQIQLARERRAQLRSELNKICEMSILLKNMLLDQEKEADMRVQAYMKHKAEREHKLAMEKKFEKQTFLRKQQLLFDLQQKRLESRSQSEDAALTRQQEKIEREYRQKEKEAAIRKKEIEREMAEARNNQLRDARVREALQIARSEDDFRAVLENLKKEEAKQAEIQEERLKNRDRYRKDIIRQMNDKELERRRMKVRDRQDAQDWIDQERDRMKNVKAIIQMKLAVMRDANLPEKYIKDVEKQLKDISDK